MQTTKYALLLALVISFSLPGFSQGDAGFDWRDSSKVRAKDQRQQSEFMSNNYPYPAKPRNKWELGFAAGNNMIFGDVKGKIDLGGAITLRKAISHTFSIRPGYFGSYNQGYPSGWGTIQGQRSFQNWTHMFGLDMIASLNPASKYRGNPKKNIYLLGGYSLIASKVFYRAAPGGRGNHIDGAYKVYYGGYNTNPTNDQNGVMTTFGGYKNKVNGRRGWSLLNGASAGGGVAFKLNKKVNLGIEQRFTFTAYDGLDAFVGGKANDIYSFTSARLNLNIGSSARRVEPLWWINPHNFVYNEINRPSHMKLPPQLLPDADGDGVTDQFDMEPNTPAGVPVDVRGRAKDTDGDGVPDYKDKELLTSTKCLPVDADGVGTCPEPACCKELRDSLAGGAFTDGTGTQTGGGCPGLNNLPSIQFADGSVSLNAGAMSMLTGAAAQIKGQPECRVRVTGHGASNKAAQQLSWDRVNAVIRYLVEKQGVSQDRFIFTYGEEGSANTVDLIGTREQGPNNVPAPHPNMRRRR
jgi:outer membrane protein OmpA-like peptidoglycan-associated protein